MNYTTAEIQVKIHSPRFPWYTRPGTQDQAVGETSIAEAFAICETTTENVGLTALLFHERSAFPLSSRTALIPYSSYRVARESCLLLLLLLLLLPGEIEAGAGYQSKVRPSLDRGSPRDRI